MTVPAAPPVQLRIIFWTGSDKIHSSEHPSWVVAPRIVGLRDGSWLRASSSERSLRQTQLPRATFLAATTKASEHEKVPGASLFTVAPRTAPNSGGVAVPRTKPFQVLAFKEQICKRRGRA